MIQLLYVAWPEGRQWLKNVRRTYRSFRLSGILPEATADVARGSSAYRELYQEDDRGSYPRELEQVYESGLVQLRAAVAVNEGLPKLLAPERFSLLSVEALVRLVLESSARAWWLLDPKLSRQTRLEHSLLQRWRDALRSDRRIAKYVRDPGLSDNFQGLIDHLEAILPLMEGKTSSSLGACPHFAREVGILSAEMALFMNYLEISTLDFEAKPAIGPQSSKVLREAKSLGLEEVLTTASAPTTTQLVRNFWATGPDQHEDGADLYADLCHAVHADTDHIIFNMLSGAKESPLTSDEHEEGGIGFYIQLAHALNVAITALSSALGAALELFGQPTAQLSRAIDEIREGLVLPNAAGKVMDQTTESALESLKRLRAADGTE